MIINKFNKKKGQALLITTMLIATVLTVFLSVSFKSQTETQLVKLEEENQKAIAAAQAGIEKALKSNTPVSINTLSSDFSDFSGNANCSNNYDKNYFITPLIEKDGQYTFYLANYPDFNSFYTGNVTIYFKTQLTTTTPALEITKIKSDNSVERYLVDPGNLIEDNDEKLNTTTNSTNLGGITFGYKTTTLINVFNDKVLIIRSLFSPTKIGISGSTNPLKSQGKICLSSATSTTVTKKIELFQSYPQIPAEFFVTSF